MCSPLRTFPILPLSGVDRMLLGSVRGLYPAGVVSNRSALFIHLRLGLPRALFPPTFIFDTSFATVASYLLITWPYHERCDWIDHCIAPELFISGSVFPCFALNELCIHVRVFISTIDASIHVGFSWSVQAICSNVARLFKLIIRSHRSVTCCHSCRLMCFRIRSR